MSNRAPNYNKRSLMEQEGRKVPAGVARVAKAGLATEALELAKKDHWTEGDDKQRRVRAIRHVIATGKIDMGLAHRHLEFLENVRLAKEKPPTVQVEPQGEKEKKPRPSRAKPPVPLDGLGLKHRSLA